MSPLRATLSLLRTFALAGAANLGSLPTLEPLDSFRFGGATPTEDRDRLGELVDNGEVGPGRDDLKEIVHKPEVDGDHGYAVIEGKNNRWKILTVALDEDITGIEATELVQAGAENYFADAWQAARAEEARRRGIPVEQLPHDAISFAINSELDRSQDRLHIHADAVDQELGQHLKEQIDRGDFSKGGWTQVDAIHGNHQYEGLWIEGENLTFNPFKILFDRLVAEHGGGKEGEAYARAHMGEHSIAVVPQTDAQGKKGFLLLVGRSRPEAKDNSGHAEEWLICRN